MGFWKGTFAILRNFFIFFVVLCSIPGLPPKTHFPIAPFSVTPARPLPDHLANNYLLNNGERLFEGKLRGPECLLTRNGDIYAATSDGIVKLRGDHITHVAKFGEPCEPHQTAKCGRPLGMVFDTISSDIIVADAYYGIWSVNLDNGKKTRLISPDDEFEGKVVRKAKIFNSVAVSKSGDIFWTDSSSDFQLDNGIQSFLANPSGRLFHYNRSTGVNKVLIDNLYFANGLVLSPNEDFVVVVECAASQLLRYYLKGPKAGQSDIFVDGLPGVPDNLTPDFSGIWVPLIMTRDSAHPALWQSTTKPALIRKFLLRFLTLLELPFQTIQNFYPNHYTEIILNKIGSFDLLVPFVPSKFSILRVDWNGKIVEAFHGNDRSIASIVHVLEIHDHLYLGSFLNNYLARVQVPNHYKSGLTTTTTTTPKPTPDPAVVRAEQERKAAEEKRRQEALAEQKRQAALEEQQRQAALEEQKRQAALEEQQRQAALEEQQRQVALAEQQRQAAIEAQQKQAALEEQQRQQAALEAQQRQAALEEQQRQEAAQKQKPVDPAPIHENIKNDVKPPPAEPLKVIKKDGAHAEL